MKPLNAVKTKEKHNQDQAFTPSNELISEFEFHCGLSLPESYLLFLKHWQSGHPKPGSNVPRFNSSDGRWSVDVFYNLDGDRVSDTSMWAAIKIWRPILGESCLPFACDSEGNQFYLDYSSCPPVVRICIHSDYFRSIDVATSFEAFAAKSGCMPKKDKR